ncbi:MAG: hypothetical protein PHQ14_14225, partial [Chromatiales bacterium]|nr:hypothetical protein [Chromatiales bacterium]
MTLFHDGWLRAIAGWCLILCASSSAADGGADASRFHTSPACWSEPRIFHAGPPPAVLANRVHRVDLPRSIDPPGDAVVAPDGGYRFWLRN